MFMCRNLGVSEHGGAPQVLQRELFAEILRVVKRKVLYWDPVPLGDAAVKQKHYAPAT